jgi:hypothetical protein
VKAPQPDLLAELPDPNKLVAFDRNRSIMTTMAESVERATREQLAELVQLLVERVTAKERVIDPATIEWTPPARPFFGKVRGYGAPGRIRTADAHLRRVPLYPLSYGGPEPNRSAP